MCGASLVEKEIEEDGRTDGHARLLLAAAGQIMKKKKTRKGPKEKQRDVVKSGKWTEQKVSFFFFKGTGGDFSFWDNDDARFRGDGVLMDMEVGCC